MKPIFIINFKTYKEASGRNALELAKICEKVALETGEDIRVAVEAPDIRSIANSVEIPVYAQHIDDVEPGSHTGWILAEAVKEAGAEGTLLNHSEHRLRMDVLEKTIKRAEEVGLEVICCANDSAVAEAAFSLGPDIIAVEPPELIGGDVSVSSAQPELIAEAVDRVKGVILVGAGVKNGSDVKKSLELGAKGVLVASGIAKADNPEKALRELLNYGTLM